MYRHSLETMAADTDAHTTDPHFIQRVGSLPIVTTAIGQLATIYQYSKESNRYVKYTLETAEAGVKTVAQTAMPVVANKLERPIAAIDSVACGQLDKLEERYPIITKPTDLVVEETKKVYETTLKPHVDTVTGVAQSSIEKVGAAKQYTVDKVNQVKDFTTSTVTGVKDYTFNTVAATASYGKDKLDAALETPAGQTVISKVDKFLDSTDQYVDYYLPDQPKDGAQPTDIGKVDMVVASNGRPSEMTFSKLTSVGDKARRRMYAKSMRDLQNVQRRSKETLHRLNFTVDLIEYAKSNIDGAKTKLTSARSKFLDVWEQINQEEGEQIEMSDLGAGNGDVGTDKTTVTNATIEKRAIATARHLTSKLKKSFNTMVTTGGAFLPTPLQTQLSAAKVFTENLYSTFLIAKTVDDVPTTILTQTRAQVTQLQNTLTSYTEFIRTNYLTALTGSSIPGAEVKGDGETTKKTEIGPAKPGTKAADKTPQGGSGGNPRNFDYDLADVAIEEDDLDEDGIKDDVRMDEPLILNTKPAKEAVYVPYQRAVLKSNGPTKDTPKEPETATKEVNDAPCVEAAKSDAPSKEVLNVIIED